MIWWVLHARLVRGASTLYPVPGFSILRVFYPAFPLASLPLSLRLPSHRGIWGDAEEEKVTSPSVFDIAEFKIPLSPEVVEATISSIASFYQISYLFCSFAVFFSASIIMNPFRFRSHDSGAICSSNSKKLEFNFLPIMSPISLMRIAALNCGIYSVRPFR